jgi:hypothetical protein
VCGAAERDRCTVPDDVPPTEPGTVWLHVRRLPKSAGWGELPTLGSGRRGTRRARFRGAQDRRDRPR